MIKFSQYIEAVLNAYKGDLENEVYTPDRMPKKPLSQMARRVLSEAEHYFSYLTDDQIENFGEEIKSLVMDNDWKIRWGGLPRSDDYDD